MAPIVLLLAAATAFAPPRPVHVHAYAGACTLHAARCRLAPAARSPAASVSLQCELPPAQQQQPPPRRALRWTVALAAFAGSLMPRALLAASVATVATAARWYTVSWTIPVIAGLLNWATNRLAVLMMFYPLKFRGFNRFFGLKSKIGWVGIVPGKAKVMANKIVDDVVLRLIDLRTVFARLPADEMADALEPVVLDVGTGLATELLERKGLSALAKPLIGSSLFQDTLRTRGRELVVEFVRDIQAEPEAVFDLRDVVVRGLRPKVLVELFERCGEQDLKFVVNSGLFLGGALGVLQAILWKVWSPWWSLALTGAAVGMVTDQLALNLIFLPVEPKKVGPLTIQGLFLKRQAQVSAEFSEYVVANVLTAKQLWDELITGSRSAAFWKLLALRVDAAIGVAPDGGLPNLLGQGTYQFLGREDWLWLRKEAIARLRVELPKALPSVYELTDTSLDLQGTMVEKMGKLSSAEFERVLHPVFEEDEWTLILVGGALGAIAGAAQAACGV